MDTNTSSADVCTTEAAAAEEINAAARQHGSSVHHLVPSQPLQAGAVGIPVGGAVGGQAPIVVEVYALGAGIAVVAEEGDLSGTEGALELEAHGKRFVINPLHSRKAHRLVPAVQGDVAAIRLELQAVNQHELAKFRNGLCHGAPSAVKTAILSLPQSWGKTSIASAMAAFIGCEWIVDEWNPLAPVFPGALHLTNVCFEGGAA